MKSLYLIKFNSDNVVDSNDCLVADVTMFHITIKQTLKFEYNLHMFIQRSRKYETLYAIIDEKWEVVDLHWDKQALKDRNPQIYRKFSQSDVLLKKS